MTYLYITPFFPSPTNWRGAYCYDFVVALQKRGVDVRVFVPGSGGDYTIGGVHVYTFPVKELPSAIFPFFYRRRNEQSFLKKVNEVVEVEGESRREDECRSFGFDSRLRLVVHAHTARFAIYALALKRLFPNCRTLLHHHDPQSFGLNLGILRHSFFYNAWLFRKFRKVFEEIDCHVFISEAVKRSFLSAPDASWTDYAVYRRQMRGPKFFRCRPVRVKDSIVLHNGVDTSVFNESKSKVEVSTSQLTLGCIGNFVDWKEQATLIRALEILKSSSPSTRIHVIFIGSGPLLEDCKRLAASISTPTPTTTPTSSPSPSTSHFDSTLTFDFFPEVPHEQLADFYRSLDLFVLPSVFEGFGCVFTEAWACGVPFITCEGQGMDDLIPAEDRHLWLCKPHDPVDLADKIAHFIAHRPVQRLSGPVSFDELIDGFMKRNGLIECPESDIIYDV